MIKISPADQETLRAAFAELKDALEDIPKYMGRKAAKIITATVNIEKILNLMDGDEDKKPQKE